MTENLYIRWLSTDFGVCKPVIAGDALTAIPEQVALRVYQTIGTGPQPTLYLDLEQLQVVDYSAVEGVSEAQRKYIAGLHATEPIRPEEMIFFALRSLFQFSWPTPTSNDDLRFAAAYDHVLRQVLAETALDLAKEFTAPAALLPYWGRLTFLKVMGGLPSDNIARFGLDRVVCTLIKKAKFNATRPSMPREKHKGRKPRGESTDAMAWGGPTCSSDEGSVMGLERRGRVRQS